MAKFANTVLSHGTAKLLGLACDEQGDSTVTIAFSLSVLGLATVVAILVLDSTFHLGYGGFGQNILNSLRMF